MTAREVRAGDTVGRYLLVRRLGSGGMGTVFEATHTLLGSRVALKVLNPSVAENVEVVDRFFREGRAAARIQHRHVVRVTDVDCQDGVSFLVMEHLEGEDLAARLRRDGPLALEDALDVLLPVMDAVAAAHAAFIVHRDLKPENVFLTTGRRGELHPKVLDFGISKALDAWGGMASLTRPHTTLGTPHYMSPEQARGASKVGPPTDQYAIATILYECLSGTQPFDGMSLLELLDAIVHTPCRPLREVAPHVPEEVAAIVARGMAKEPEARFASVTAFARALLPYAREATRVFWARELTDADAPTVPRQSPLVVDGSSGSGIDAPGYETADTIVDTTLGGAVREVEVPAARARAGSRRWLAIGAAAALVLAGAGGVLAWTLHASTAATIETSDPAPVDVAPAGVIVSVRTEPPEATLELDGERVGRGSVQREVTASAPHTLRVHADGYEPQTFVFQGAPPPTVVRLRRIENEAAERGGGEEPESGEEVAVSEPEAAPRAASRRVRVRNTRRAAVTITLSCEGTDERAEVAGRRAAALRVSPSACTVTCTGRGEPRCPSRIGARESTIVIR